MADAVRQRRRLQQPGRENGEDEGAPRPHADMDRELVQAAADEHDYAADPERWQPYQRAWYANLVAGKDAAFALAYVACTAAYVALTPPYRGATRSGSKFFSNETRACVTVALAAFAVAVMYVDIFKSTPPRRGDRKWVLLGGGFAGHFSFLTVHILMAQVSYWTLCAALEVAWVCAARLPDWGVELLERAVAAAYSMTVFSSVLGVVLTLLFLKFNWFEAAWRRDVLEMYLKRGNRMFVRKVLITHLPQLPIALFDLVALKQTHGILEACTPSVVALLAVSVAYSGTYLALTHAAHRANGGVYPYPFLDKVFATWRGELVFYTAISTLVFLLAVLARLVAVEAALVESTLGRVLGVRSLQG